MTIDPFIKMQAQERLVSMLTAMERTMDFLEDHQIRSTRSEKKYIGMVMERLKGWLDKID